MSTIIRHLHRFRRNKRGVSNIIVIVLSLVILVIVASNVILWSYQMNQLDWEKMQEKLKITDVARINSSVWFTTQSEYTVSIGNHINSTYQDTTAVDNSYETFQEENQTTIHPNAAGQYAEWGIEVPTEMAHWNCCNEDPPNDDNSYVQTTTQSWQGEVYSLKDIAGSGNINWVRVYIRAKHNNVLEPASYIRTLIRTHDTDYTSENIDLTTSYQNLNIQYDTNPLSGLPWTWDEVNSLQAGAFARSFGNRFVRLTKVWVVVNHGAIADINGIFTMDISTYSLTEVNGVEVKLRYRASDAGERWYLKAYNWTSGEYSGNGFNSTAGHLPTTAWDYYTVNLTDEWQGYIREDGIMNIKFHDAGADINQTTIDIDFLAVRVLIEGTCFFFKSEGALTCHIISIWIVNCTIHTRYVTDIYINAGESINYIRTDISLPDGSYFVKATTERGNIAVYSPS